MLVMLFIELVLLFDSGQLLDEHSGLQCWCSVFSSCQVFISKEFICESLPTIKKHIYRLVGFYLK